MKAILLFPYTLIPYTLIPYTLFLYTLFPFPLDLSEPLPESYIGSIHVPSLHQSARALFAP